MSSTLDSKLAFRLGNIYRTPFSKEIPIESLRNESSNKIFEELSRYQKERIKADKKGDSYTLVELKKIADILGIRKNQNKTQLAEQILEKWSEKFPDL